MPTTGTKPVYKIESDLLDPDVCSHIIFESYQEFESWLSQWWDMSLGLQYGVTGEMYAIKVTVIEMTDEELANLKPYDP